MKALILAGGFGTRLRPLTLTRPKHLLPIANVPHIERVFDLLLGHGISDVVLTTSYLADTFASTVTAAKDRGMSIEVTHEAEPRGTAGAIKNAEAHVRDATFLVFNGDILTGADLTEIIRFHRTRGAEASILLAPVEDPSAFGVVPTDDEGRVLGFLEKPPRHEAPTNLINAGVYVMEPSVLERIPAGAEWSAERALFPGLVEDGARLYALATDAYWMDIGTSDKYLQANLDVLEGRCGAPALPNGAVASDVRVGEGAQVSSSCLGAGCLVGEGAIIDRSVLLPGVEVGPGARVSASVLGEGARVARGAKLHGYTAADAEQVAA